MNYGVKLVEAETEEGAMFGYGFITARDRLWQIKFFRHLTQGRLSELIGTEGLEIDRMIRTVGITRAAQAVLDNLDDREKLALQMFSNGINKAVESMKAYPIEFYILWTDFGEPWTPLDSISISYFMCFTLS